VLFITEYRSQDSEFRRLLLFVIFSPAPHSPPPALLYLLNRI